MVVEQPLILLLCRVYGLSFIMDLFLLAKTFRHPTGSLGMSLPRTEVRGLLYLKFILKKRQKGEPKVKSKFNGVFFLPLLSSLPLFPHHTTLQPQSIHKQLCLSTAGKASVEYRHLLTQHKSKAEESSQGALWREDLPVPVLCASASYCPLRCGAKGQSSTCPIIISAFCG
jgi:hypothetical protein